MYRFSWKNWLRTLSSRAVSRRAPVVRISRSVEQVEDRTLLSFQLVDDINAISRDSTPQEFVQIGNLTYFTADDGVHGRELWKTDGTVAGTVLVKDIHPTDSLYSGSYPSHLTNVGGVLYFTADDGVHGKELWKSNGTSAGTQLVADLQAGGAFSSSDPHGLVDYKGTLFFTADNGIHGRELWSSNGSQAGTQRITDLNTAGDSFRPETQPVNFNGQLVFAATQGPGSSLWISNGTTGGTTLLKNIQSGGDGVPHFDEQHVAATASTLYFVADNGFTGEELWKTDGTGPGTVLVKEINVGTSSNPQELTVIGNTLYFAATDPTNGRELWTSDGSSGGTTMVKNIRLGNSGSSPTDLISFQGQLYFSADDGIHGAELWQSDGSTGGTVLLEEINPTSAGSSPRGFFAVGSTLFFMADDGANGSELWRSDGSDAATQMVSDIRPGIAGSSDEVNRSVMGVNGSTLLFSANDGQHGLDLWTSTGVAGGTALLKDINPITQGSYPSFLANVPGGVVFAANDGQSGDEIWFSNGVIGVSLPVMDANSGVAGSDPRDFTQVNNIVFFTALNGSLGRELWTTDGTPEGTMIVLDINPGVASSNPQDLVNINSTLYFSATDDVFGRELWKSDGTTLGTERVADIANGGVSSSPDEIIGIGSTIYFRANGDELWTSDGSGAGTHLVIDVNPAGNSRLAHLTNLGGALFFAADDGTHGIELWQSDGSPGGTQQVLDIQDGEIGSSPRELTVSNGLLFFVADDGIHGAELWASNGTPEGTQIVLDIALDANSSQPEFLTDVNGQLFFVATDDTHGEELWVSNGTAGGTQMVRDLQTGAAGSNPNQLTNLNGTLYFAANDGVHGLEPWTSTGTLDGTQMLADVNPGTMGSVPRGFANFGSFVLFAADDGLHGVELLSNVTNHAPVLADAQYIVAPGAPNGTLIATLVATDVEVGQTKTYAIVSGNTSDAFALNPTTGELTVNNSAALDLDVNPIFTLTVKVTDNGSPVGFSLATITISLPVPNQVPSIANQTFSLPENSANNVIVGTVLATDADMDQVLSYAITGGNSAGAFTINLVTGQIRVANSALLDFETTPSFTLTVQATDNGFVPQSASATITINLTNIDEPMRITLPPGSVNYTRKAPPLLAGAGATITDPDTPLLNFQNGKVVVAISQGQIKTDKLTLVNGGGITRKGKNVLFNGTAIGTLTGGKKGAPITVSLNANGTTAAAQQILRQVGFANTSGKTPAGTRSIQFKVTDSSNHTSPAVTKVVTVV